MGYQQIQKMFQDFGGDGGPFDWSRDQRRLIVHAARAVATGHPLTPTRVEALAARLEIPLQEAQGFLTEVAEQDDDGNVVGVFGLSQRQHKHQIELDGVELTAWCAEDTLFLPFVIGTSARVRSVSPASETVIELEISPEGVTQVSHPEAVLTFPVVDVRNADVASAESIWMTFCRLIHFFPSRAEAQSWAALQGGLAIVTVAEGFELGRAQWEESVRLALESGLSPIGSGQSL